MMRRLICLLAVLALVCCHASAAGKKKKKPEKKGRSRPSKSICWTAKDKDKAEGINVEYTIVPLDCIDPAVHDRCRKLVRENADKGFLFFVVIINNKRGKKPVKFSAYGGDAHFYWFPRKKDEKDKTEEAPPHKKCNLINLTNWFAEKRSVADKIGYKRVQEMFKTKLTVAPGSYGWSLACIRDSFVFNIKGPRPNQVTWAIPGSKTGVVLMKVKSFSKGLLRKAGVKFFEK